ncbi:hypothetical protein, unlikely [Trypanosoma brucei gambiense DAL972]|uniref:Uncharacterized protein n=1 Tax=Trypanosoma brucei gambiense (strain MHOM/CI/86/DAL972) TaxID=679716 RepID=C9ZL89_TRYB9|nr:hypothetical protein, unlikely [Trypanosoma brucei gambiense DAL972]CBH10098.1 hypothetical protein, unlikely [Trypanosoma brucei gambiense DAL972]|eukprot:XP_011772388.1 hypothetical protein, unlikely [Trypanosoma brucei gambiense DAL972]
MKRVASIIIFSFSHHHHHSRLCSCCSFLFPSFICCFFLHFLSVCFASLTEIKLLFQFVLPFLCCGNVPFTIRSYSCSSKRSQRINMIIIIIFKRKKEGKKEKESQIS